MEKSSFNPTDFIATRISGIETGEVNIKFKFRNRINIYTLNSNEWMGLPKSFNYKRNLCNNMIDICVEALLSFLICFLEFFFPSLQRNMKN